MDRLFGQATPGPPPTLKPPPPTSDRSHLRLLLISAEPAGAEPESSCSPARDRDAGAGRNELDTGEHRPQSPAQEQATTGLTQRGPRSAWPSLGSSASRRRADRTVCASPLTGNR